MPCRAFRGDIQEGLACPVPYDPAGVSVESPTTYVALAPMVLTVTFEATGTPSAREPLLFGKLSEASIPGTPLMVVSCRSDGIDGIDEIPVFRTVLGVSWHPDCGVNRRTNIGQDGGT